jgi:mannose/cellobiose epimerase-like protein (N-acyl-D-glucosamine 2-epimerase family)
MVVDRWDVSFGQLEPYRGVNANMHTVEAYLAAADVTENHQWRERALRIIDRVVNNAARANQWRIPEHYNAAWQPQLEYNCDQKADQFRPYGATPGHGLEWSRLVLQARASLGPGAPDWMLEAAIALYDRAVADGWIAAASAPPNHQSTLGKAALGDGGFVYTVDWQGQPVVTARLNWVIAEAIGAAATLYRATGQTRYAEDYQRFWDHAASHFIDRQRGSWFHELNSSLQPDTTIWQGKPDIYHALQATLIPRLPMTPALAPALAAGLLP